MPSLHHGRSLSDTTSALAHEQRKNLTASASQSSSTLNSCCECDQCSYTPLIDQKHSLHPYKHSQVAVDLSSVTDDTKKERFPQEKLKALGAFLFLMTAGLSNDLVLAYIHELVPSSPPLPDVFFSYTPYVPWALVLSEYLILASTLAAFTIVFLHKYRYIVLRRVFFIAGLLYLGRSVSMFVTQVPVADPKYYCSPKLNSTSFSIIVGRAFALMSGLGLKINEKHTLCGDYIYSGHTTVLVLSYLIVREYSPRRWWYVHWLSCLLSLAGVVSLLLSRGHYTVDVIIAYWVTTRLFWLYHTLANYPHLKEYSCTNLLSRVCWFPLFRFLEANVSHPVPRRFEWPLPWPKSLCRIPTKSNVH